MAHVTLTPSSIVANQDPETTRELWESEGTFSRYRLDFRGTNNVPEQFLGQAEWRDHQGVTGYYAEPYNFPSAGPVAFEFNLDHLCWVEVRWRRTDSQWEAFRPAAADLRLDISVMNPLISHPSHGRAYMAEGCLVSLGSDWLIVDSRALPLPTFIRRRALYQYVLSFVCSPPRTLEGGLIFVIMISECGMCFIVSADMVVGIP